MRSVQHLVLKWADDRMIRAKRTTIHEDAIPSGSKYGQNLPPSTNDFPWFQIGTTLPEREFQKRAQLWLIPNKVGLWYIYIFHFNDQEYGRFVIDLHILIMIKI